MMRNPRLTSHSKSINSIWKRWLPNDTCEGHPKSIRYSSLAVGEKSCKLLVIGGGTGGCSVAAKFASKLEKDSVIVVEPSDIHYYQPMFTLIGGGLKSFNESWKPMRAVLPKGVEWVRDSVQKIEPQGNYVMTQNGMRIDYEFLVVAAGLKVDYKKIPGLAESLATPGSGVCSNYSPEHVEKTFPALRDFDEGNLIFTFPNTSVKCAGAPQKICYIAEDYLRKTGKRGKSRILYQCALGKIFAVKKYADSLWKICRTRGIEVNLNTNLVEVDPIRRVAHFENLDSSEHSRIEIPFSVLHVTPPMGPPLFLRCSPMICDSAGFLDVDPSTLRHKFFYNIYGIGDCTNLPTSKTAAAVACQCGVLYDNLLLAMSDPDQEPVATYNGYTSCPLITGLGKCILAEFDYTQQPLETFPMDQSKESRLMFHLKKDLLPLLYWNLMLKGHWNGPETIRKLLHLDFKDRKSFDTTLPS